MSGQNKAHTATVRRVAERYGGTVNANGSPDITSEHLTVEVETSATLAQGIRDLEKVDGPVFVAVTNREALDEALRRVKRSRVGVMDPQGEIVKQSDPPLPDDFA